MERINSNKISRTEQNIGSQISTKEKESLPFDFNLYPAESGEDYLMRLNKAIYAINKKENDDLTNIKKVESGEIMTRPHLDVFDGFSKEEFDPYYKRAFRVLLDKSPEEDILNKDKNTLVLEKVEFSVDAKAYNDDIPGNKMKDNYDSINFFNKTNQERSFFPSKFRKDGYPYTYSLFGVTNINSEEAKEYLKKKLNSKRICLFGGGKSMQDLIESDLVKPEFIINIDPFLDQERVDRNIHKNYKSIDIKADDPELFKKMEEEGAPTQFDEIWASYSVPFYNINTEEIENLFDNIDKMLAEGGNCRITPLDTQNQECVDMIYRKLEDFNRMDIYNFDLLDDTIIIHKIKPVMSKKIDKHSSQEKDDKERIKFLMKEIGI